MSRIFVTGSDGFVGRALVNRLRSDGYMVRCGHIAPFDQLAAHDPSIRAALEDCEHLVIGDIGPHTDWRPALRDVDAIIHLAARAHVVHESAKDPLAEFRRVNTAGAESLASAAADAGVQRMVFISSIGVHGSTNRGGAFTEASPIRPDKDYAISKWEAECALRRIADERGLETVIVRPPLVYGPHVRGNFRRLLDWANKALPLPLGGIKNHRTFVALENLVDALALCAAHEDAAGQTFIVGDNESVSTPHLIRKLAGNLGRPYRLVPMPEIMLRLPATILGRSEDAERLLGSLVVDTAHIRKTLGWTPRVSLDDGLARMCEWYKHEVAAHD